MNTHLNQLVTTSAVMLLGLMWAGGALARQDSPDMPAPSVNRVSCQDVEWHRGMLRHYPWVMEACQEAIVIDGEKWARFEAEFQQLHRDGSITSTFRNSRGRSVGNVRLMPGTNQRVLLDGRPYQFSQLRRGQVLNFYAPEDVFAFTTEPGVPEAELVQIVEPRQEREPTEIARAEPVTTTLPTTLPATAGPLPIIALGGLLSLLGGFSLTMRRRSMKPRA